MRKMKNSGIEWIGDIPEDWEVGRLKNIFTVYPYIDTSFIDLNSDVTFLPMENIKRGFYINSVRKFSEYTSSYNIFEEGDILLAKVTPCFENGNIALAKKLTNAIGFGTSEIFVIRKLGSNEKFIFYYLQGEHFRQRAIATMTGVGGLKRIAPAFMKNEVAIIPPLPEQQRIADYLDAKCARIDESAELVRQSMEKLRAYKLSLITEAVTKGLDPDVPMKDSGIPWIGEIPKGWEVSRLGGYTIKIGSGKTPLGGAAIYQSSGIPFIRSQNVFNNKFNVEDVVFISKDMDEEMASSRVFCNDILFNITGASIGRSCVYNLKVQANVNQHVCIVRCKMDAINNKFVNYVLISSATQEYIKFIQNGANREGLNFSQVRNIRIPVPPLAEQKRIADYLDDKCARIDAVLEEKERLLESLSEYKKSLIFECVTGKREVSA